MDEFETEFLHFLNHIANELWLIEGISEDWKRRAEITKIKADSLYKSFEQYRTTRRAVWN